MYLVSFLFRDENVNLSINTIVHIVDEYTNTKQYFSIKIDVIFAAILINSKENKSPNNAFERVLLDKRVGNDKWDASTNERRSYTDYEHQLMIYCAVNENNVGEFKMTENIDTRHVLNLHNGKQMI